MKAILLPIVTACTLLTAQSAAAEILFDCTTLNNKELTLTDNGDTLSYQFGEKSQPEIQLTVSKNEAIYTDTEGRVGRSTEYELGIPADNESYGVFRSMDKNTRKVESGVKVYLPSGVTPTIFCHPNKVRTDKLDNIDDVPVL